MPSEWERDGPEANAEVQHAVGETARVALAYGIHLADIEETFGLPSDAVERIARDEPGAWDGIAAAGVRERIMGILGLVSSQPA